MKRAIHVSFGDHGYFKVPENAGVITGVQRIDNTVFVFTSTQVFQFQWPEPWYRRVIARIRGWFA